VQNELDSRLNEDDDELMKRRNALYAKLSANYVVKLVFIDCEVKREVVRLYGVMTHSVL